MSEYQYYEFQALDRPLTQREMRELRKHSTRATITDTRFVNHYEWGNFKGDTSVWMRKYFDAFLYYANWGTHRLMLRLSSGALDVKTAKRYLGARSVTAHRKDNTVILDFGADDDSGDWTEDGDGSGLLSSLIALRTDIGAGDHRALYLGWLSAALRGDLRDKEVEPPVPPGMATLSAPLKALANFLYVSADLIQVAAERSQPMDQKEPPQRLERWVSTLSDSEKTALLSPLVTEDGRSVRAELLRRFRNVSRVSRPASAEKPRTVGTLLDGVDGRAHQAVNRSASDNRTRDAKLLAPSQPDLEPLNRGALLPEGLILAGELWVLELRMGRKSITGGVIPAGLSRIRFDFTVDGQRFRPTLPWIPNEANLQRARTHLAQIKAQIAAGSFCFSDEFPRYRGLRKIPPALQHRTCGQIFDAFLRHEEARLARGDLAAATVASHRKILDYVWRPHLKDLPFLGIRYSMLIKIADAYTCNKKTYNNAVSALRRAFDFGYLDYPERRDPAASLKCARIGKNDRPPIDPFSIQDAEVLIAAIHRDWGEAQGNYDELRFFTGLRPSEEIALVVTDYDAVHGVLSITKARVLGIDKDVTKTGEDRRIRLCPRAIAVIERQLRLRERVAREGRIDHDRLFFTDSGRPIPDVKYPYTRWQRTLLRLAIRYRKPYMARHTSVSWNLMVGRNPLLVAKEHGHRPTTMLSVYAAWTEGAVEADINAIRDAMNCGDGDGTRREMAGERWLRNFGQGCKWISAGAK